MACKASPDDDLPRRILADWLEENGQADRAEFIRLQLQRRVQEEPVHREEELLEQHQRDWLGPLGRTEAPGQSGRGRVVLGAGCGCAQPPGRS